MSNNQDKNQTRFAEIFKALSNPNRLSIFLSLVSCCPPDMVGQREKDFSKCVGDVCCEVAVGPSTVSHHLKELRQAGLIEITQQGQHRECRVKTDTLHELRDFFNNIGKE